MKRIKYGWRQCIMNYRFHSIFFKNMVLLFGLIFLPFMCILGLSYYSYHHIQKSEEKVYTEELITRVSADVESIFREIRDKAIMLSVDEDAELFYRAESIEKDDFYNARDIFKFLSLYNISTEVIDSVYVYAPYSDVVISAAGRFAYEDFDDRECINRWEDEGEVFQIEYVERKVAGENKETVSFYYTIRYPQNRTGVVIINIGVGKLTKALNFSENVSLAIVHDEQILYDSKMENNGLDLEAVLHEEARGRIIERNPLKVCDLEVVIQMNSGSLDGQLGIIRAYILVFIGIMFIISILLVLYISRKIFDPFSEIMKALEEVPETGEKSLLQSKDELGYIMESIYATISRNKSVEEELVERVKLLKKAQAVALQSQINPHFINNTMETVNWMAVGQLGEGNNISEMLNSLSRLLRTSLEDSDTFATLREEIEYVEEYLFIQQKRFEDSFDVIFDISEEVEKCKVIKMLLQPIVENAIEHGITPYGKKGELKIVATRNGDRLCVYVQNSGIGIVPEKVEEINRSIQKMVIKESRHIGLTNVNQRIRLAFGDDYGIIVESKLGYGTKVTLTLPYQV